MWEMDRLQEKGPVVKVSLGNTGINNVKLFSLLPGLLVFSVHGKASSTVYDNTGRLCVLLT